MSDELTIIVEPPAKILELIGDPDLELMELESEGPQGPPGSNNVLLLKIAATNLSGHRVVKAVSGNKASYPDIDDPFDGEMLLGVTTGAVSADDDVLIQHSGEMQESTWAWSLGPVFCADDGVLVQSIPTGMWTRQVGVAIAPDKLLIDMRSPVLI